MIFTDLNASNFDFNKDFYVAEFEDLLSKIIFCYHLMLSDNITLVNSENKMRDVLMLNYLKNNEIRKDIGLTNFLFDREVPEDTTIGRTDIKVQTINSFEDTSAYYIIECKRLNNINPTGKTGLNAKYISEGLHRFSTDFYASHYKVNGMIAFIINDLDINKNIDCINKLLSTSFSNVITKQPLTSILISKNFDYSYFSRHRVKQNDIDIYHLMLDVSKNIN